MASSSNFFNRYRNRRESNIELGGSYIESLYKRMIDNNGHLYEKILKVCDMLNINPNDII
jgi:hypothetical protein